MKKTVLVLAIGVCSIFGTAASIAAHDAKSCSTECKSCAEMCQKTLDYCVKKGGAHAKAEHVNLMKDCIAVCKLNSELRGRDSKYASDTSKVCSKICTDCAKSCEDLKDPKMKDCVEACKSCADCCGM